MRHRVVCEKSAELKRAQLLEELVEFAQLVCQRVARLDLDRERHVGRYGEFKTLILEFDSSPEGDVI
jgi:hypothetical protein